LAIGNEKIWTVDDPRAVPAALLGMDLVRLGLERARTADDAVTVITELLARHGQGGSGEREADEPYFSSFLIADPRGGWILETSNRTWAARPIDAGASISNRITLGTDWTRASADVPAGRSFDEWRAPDVPTGIADPRLAQTRACVARGAVQLGAADLAATMREHGTGPWGAPGTDGSVKPIPAEVQPDWTGMSVCMHLRDYQCTTGSMIAELPRDDDVPMRTWHALGSPCVSVYVPGFPDVARGIPVELADPARWAAFDALRVRAEHDPDALAAIRAVTAPVEAELWDEADDAADSGDPELIRNFVATAFAPVDRALTQLAACF
ncbi:MAG: peptidase family protein, partial [Actinomycetia bacterium]|nr:peptidase family protein [Actinomycetes bacterium]